MAPHPTLRRDDTGREVVSRRIIAALLVVHEATAHPGGRCRSFYDRSIDMGCDNGNHLVLTGKRAGGGVLGRPAGEGLAVEEGDEALLVLGGFGGEGGQGEN